MAQDPITLIPKNIPFQYNPARVVRTLQPNVVGAGPGDRTDAIRYWGPPTERFQVELQLSAVSGINSGDAGALDNGIGPDLAVLELLVYPPVAQAVAEQALLALGTIEVAPPLAPIALFSWGSRVAPIAIESMTITEEAFDASLNPVQASVQMAFRTLNYTDVTPLNPVYALYMAYQLVLEAKALEAS